MGLIKKNKRLKASSKRTVKDTVIVIKTTGPAKETLFPEKLKKVNDMLAKAKLMDK